mmetsp:Transcript_106225/g.327896  ORF Transcript_106225/g.327896 Transcript_106225/m.327896 type:complete len:205 (+) Transcript_106225:1-615(+)
MHSVADRSRRLSKAAASPRLARRGCSAGGSGRQLDVERLSGPDADWHLRREHLPVGRPNRQDGARSDASRTRHPHALLQRRRHGDGHRRRNRHGRGDRHGRGGRHRDAGRRQGSWLRQPRGHGHPRTPLLLRVADGKHDGDGRRQQADAEQRPSHDPRNGRGEKDEAERRSEGQRVEHALRGSVENRSQPARATVQHPQEVRGY